MDLQLRDKHAFISGSTQGIGYAIATALAAEGAKVVLNGRDPTRTDAAVARLREEVPGADVSAIAGDVSAALGDLGDVDILVNNAGLFALTDFATLGDDEWQRYLDVNLLSAVRLSREVLPGMLERGGEPLEERRERRPGLEFSGFECVAGHALSLRHDLPKQVPHRTLTFPSK